MLTRPPPTPRDPDAPPAAPLEPGAQRISVLCGERACIACAFNLSGQPVVREPHYDMLIVRCPECGAVASLQEYPALGTWATRWTALAAALYIVLLLGGAFGAGAIGYGFCEAAIDGSGYRFAQFLSDRQTSDLAAAGLPPTTTMRAISPTPFDAVSMPWLAKQDTSALLAAGAPWRGLILPEAVPLWAAQCVTLYIVRNERQSRGKEADAVHVCAHGDAQIDLAHGSVLGVGGARMHDVGD